MGTITAPGAGLEGVVAGESEICYIDGQAGVLSYRGYNIHTLAENATFEEVIYLLWYGRLPKQEDLDQLKRDLVANYAHSSAGRRFSRRRSPGRAHGRAAHRRFHARRARSRHARHVALSQPAQGAQADGADRHHRHHLRPSAQRQARAPARSRAGASPANFLYTLTGQASRRRHGARLRRGPRSCTPTTN